MHRRRHLALLTAAAALLAACGGASTAEDTAAATTVVASESASQAPPTATPAPTTTPPRDAGEVAGMVDPAAQPDVDLPSGIVPARLVIPAIGVDTVVGDLSLTAAEVEVPEDFDEAGWWTQTRRPGEIGPAVIGGHVDSRSGPAVFYELDQLQPGDEILVINEAGDEVVFVVESGLQMDKYDRPPEVFGFGESRPELRLITCGGDFDPSIGHYTDNYVVFAHQADWQA